jgi:hypothetical protein
MSIGADTSDSAKKPELPKHVGKEDLPAAKAKLADLEKTIATKEQELADLRAEADGLRRQIAAKASNDKVYQTPKELFADMPKDAYPKFGPAGGIERAAARKWCKENLVGRTVEWTATVYKDRYKDRKVKITGDGPFTVTVGFQGATSNAVAKLPDNVNQVGGFSFGGLFHLGGEPCEVIIGGKGRRGGKGIWLSSFNYEKALYEAVYTECTTAEADRFRKLKGEQLVLRAKVIDTDVCDQEILSGEGAKDRVPIVLFVSLPSVDGFLPEASKAMDKK